MNSQNCGRSSSLSVIAGQRLRKACHSTSFVLSDFLLFRAEMFIEARKSTHPGNQMWELSATLNTAP
jgi:hypothetical protein